MRPMVRRELLQDQPYSPTSFVVVRWSAGWCAVTAAGALDVLLTSADAGLGSCNVQQAETGERP